MKKLSALLLVAAALPAWAQNDAAALAAKEPGAVVTSTGLVYRSLTEGKGASPAAADRGGPERGGPDLGGPERAAPSRGGPERA